MAQNKYSWNVNVDENFYKVEFAKSKISINNGESVKLSKFRRESKFPNAEYYIPLGSKEAVLNIRQGGEPVLTIDGRDCNTGEPFILPEMPKWAWVFVVLHGINFFLLIGGAIGGACLGGLSFLTATIASNTEMSTGKRVAISVGIWLVATIIEFVLAIFLSVLFSGL